MKPIYSSTLLFALVASLFLSGALWNIHTAKKLGGFTLIEIPADTKDILRRLADIGIGHTPIDLSDLPITDIWNNGEDLGRKDTTFYHAENGYFVVYFHKGKEALAETTLAIATRAISKMTSVFNRFPNPTTQHGRKLPIYLTDTEQEYEKLGRAVGSLAVTIGLLSPTGYFCTGIFVSPDAMSKPRRETPSDNQKVTYDAILEHELGHYTFSSLVDWSRARPFPLWLTEGLAEYVADAEYRWNEVTSNPKSLAEERSPEQGDYSSYWRGYTAMRFLSETQGREMIPTVTNTAYRTSIDSLFLKAAGLSLPQLDAEWKAFLASKRKSRIFP
ncbi:MAG: hypothetical protein RMM16_12005 [Chloroherpetonaceae bacterium]|nr:hypothetical protein [Chloroherpetonaceae bacterium]